MKFLGTAASLHWSPNGAHMEKDARFQSLPLNIHQGPQLRSFPTKEGGKIMVTAHGAPRGRKAYIQLGAAWFPKAIVYDTAITTPVPRSLPHDTIHLGFGKPESR